MTSTSVEVDLRASGLSLLRTARRAASAYGRDDLAERCSVLHDQLRDPVVTAVVLGEFKAGKSSLLNALLGADVCPVDADVSTEVPTVLRYAAEPVAHGIRRPATGDDPEALPRPEPIEPSSVARAISTDGHAWRSVEVGLPRRLLETGLALVDTPGVGGLDARHLADALGVLATADTVLFAADAAHELGGPALELLGQVAGLCPSVVLVLTKADLYHHLDRIVAANREHLDRAGLEVPVLVTSSELRQMALRTGSTDLDAESGLPDLAVHLVSLVDRADQIAARRAVATVTDVTTQLRDVFEAEAAALADPSTGTQGRPPAGPRPDHQPSWQQVLADGATDLGADLDHELRRRSRELIGAAEEALAEGDPAELWPEVSAWLEERAAADVVATFVLLRERTLAIATRVAERFEETDGRGAPVDAAVLDDLARRVLAALPDRADLPADTASKTSAGLNAMRSSFYGFLMFSTIGALVGVAAAPAALVLGLAIGGKSVRDERNRSQQQRRVQAKSAVRAYVDEVTFVTGKESRDGLRNVQRALRDHFTVLASEQQRSVAEAAAAAQRARAAAATARAQRSRDIDAELVRIASMAERAASLSGAAQGPTDGAGAGR